MARIRAGLQDCLYLGNLAARRDWGYAADYVNAMWLMLQAEKPDDYVIATGVSHSVREFCELAFEIAGIPIKWKGADMQEVGVDAGGKVRVRIDPRYFRPTEVDLMQGDATYARERLGWKPTVTFKGLVKLMVEADIAALEGK